MSTKPMIRQMFKPIALLAAALLGGCDMSDGFCYTEWKRLSEKDFCDLVDADLPERRIQLKSCHVYFRNSNALYAVAEISYSDRSICDGAGCIVVFDSCGRKIKI